jgi:hypothetical protein
MVADVGDVYYAYNELQGSTQAAVLAGAMAISNPSLGTPSYTTNATPQEVATYYGAQTGSGTSGNGINTHPILTSAGQNVSTTVYLSCNSFVTSLGITCITYNGSNGATANAIQVVQVAKIKTFFAALFGQPSVTLTSTATAARAGAPSVPYNVAIILDTTESMTTTDTNCGNVSRLACSLNGIQVLLESMAPCYSSEAPPTGCGTASNAAVTPSVDRVALFTFPNISVGTVSDDTTCPSSNPTIEPYTFPASNPTASSSYDSLSPTYFTTPSTPTGANPVAVGTTTYATTYAITYGLGDADGNGFVMRRKRCRPLPRSPPRSGQIPARALRPRAAMEPTMRAQSMRQRQRSLLNRLRIPMRRM